MKNKKGFTLIELLAITVILAAIAIIVTPLVIDMVDDAKKKSFEHTASALIKAGEVNYSDEQLISSEIVATSFTYVDGVEVSIPSGKSLEYKGAKPKSGTVVVNSDGNIAIAIYNGTYCAEKGFTQEQITLSEKTAEECYVPFYADLSGASAPELSNNMIPIRWDGTEWVKADKSNVIGEDQWHNYDNQEWANVALVSEGSRSTYINAEVGNAIAETDVMAYLVWIPRFRYKLFNVTAAAVAVQKIDVKFEDSSKPKENGTANGDYLTHPAFTFGSEELEGFWVGKFETTGNASTPTIKPNAIALTTQNINNQFATAKKFNATNNYGLTDANDSHMMRNMEWGAVAYLSQSSFGKYSNPTYTGAAGLEKEIYINNINTDLAAGNGAGITGCAGNTVNETMVRSATCPVGNQYQTTQGVKASTTGNIYGIYDMSGGSREYTMGAMYNTDNSTVMLLSSGFSQATIDSASMSKYVDKYTYGTTYNTQTAYDRRQLGDATGEVRAWNGDNPNFVYPTYPWLRRGGYCADAGGTGIFGFYRYSGGASSYVSFRVVVLGK